MIASIARPRRTSSLHPAAILVPTLLGLAGPAAAQERPFDLASAFDVGTLVLDTNGDSVPDRVLASLVTGDRPTPAELAAAADVAARLGFETMAMDLPLPRGLAEEGVTIVIGRSGLAEASLASPGVDPASLDAGEGVVSTRAVDGRRFVLVQGGDDEGLAAAARLFAGTLPHTRTLSVYKVGESYLGRDIWAMDLMPPIATIHWSAAKATTYKPTVIYSAREHANEVSSTSHVLRHAELLLTDSLQRRKLDRVNVVIHPFTNPDGAQLAYDLYRTTPDYILHAGYLGSLGQGATSGADDDHPIYPEAPVRDRLWNAWLPDIFLNPHGYPSHQVVQLFSEFTGLVRRGRVTERNWGFNKGWFMPGFGYVDDPRFPRHKDAAFRIRDYITDAINADPDVVGLNRRAYDRYERYGVRFDPDVFRLPLVDDVLIEMPLKGSDGQGGGRNPRVTIWSGTTEAPDETAHGPWMELVAGAGLSWDRALLDYLYDGAHRVERSGSAFFGGVSLRMHRPRPPEDPEEDGATVSTLRESGS